MHRASYSQRRNPVTVLTYGLLVAALLILAGGRLAAFSPPSSSPRTVGSVFALGLAPAAQVSAEHAEEVSRQTEHGEPWWAQLGRLVNFLVLVGVLVYFLRRPIASYLSGRSVEIRGDLTKAEEMRRAAEQDMAAIEARMKALPREIEELKVRGAQEIAAEEARIRQAAETERERLLEQARREIGMQVRAAERELVKRAADLAVGLAAERINRTITNEDQDRLVDRYVTTMQK